LSLPLPAVVAVRLAAPGGVDLAALNAKLQSVAPGTLVEREDIWAMRLAKLARSLELTAGAVLVVVALVAAAVVAVATRAGLSARREAIETVHGLGATDGYIAARFSARITRLAAAGGLLGALVAMPVLIGLSWLAMPFLRGNAEAPPAMPEGLQWAALLPPGLWLLLVVLPMVAAGIGWLTAQATVRQWLRRLP
jgi:cell division transport system permease protein